MCVKTELNLSRHLKRHDKNKCQNCGIRIRVGKSLTNHMADCKVKYKNTFVEGLDQSINLSAKRITKFYSVEEGELVSSLEEGEILG